MSRTDTWMPLYIGDYLADTMRLTTLQHGAYLLLLMEYWRQGPLPDDDGELAAITKVERKTWDREVAASLRRYFTVQEDGKLHQKRLDAEREKAVELSRKRRDAARQRGAGKDAKDASEPDDSGGNGGANEQQLHEQLLDQKHQQDGVQLHMQETPHAGVAPPSHSSLRSETITPPSLRSVPPKPKLEIPDWMPLEAWEGFLAMRKSSRKPITEHATRLLLAKLADYRERGLNIAEALNQSTIAGWSGVFEPKSAGSNLAPKRDGWAEMDHRFNEGTFDFTPETPTLGHG